jgi:hypothetical protein
MSAPQSTCLDESVSRLIQNALHRVRFGAITLVIHSGKIVEVTSTEKTRITTLSPTE